MFRVNLRNSAGFFESSFQEAKCPLEFSVNHNNPCYFKTVITAQLTDMLVLTFPAGTLAA